MKVLEQVLEGRVREINIDSIYYAVWIYGRKAYNRCYFHSPSAVGEIPGEEERPMNGLC